MGDEMVHERIELDWLNDAEIKQRVIIQSLSATSFAKSEYSWLYAICLGEGTQYMFRPTRQTEPSFNGHCSFFLKLLSVNVGQHFLISQNKDARSKHGSHFSLSKNCPIATHLRFNKPYHFGSFVETLPK